MSEARFVGAAITPVRTRLIRDPQRGIQLVSYYEGTAAEIATIKAGIASDQRYEEEATEQGMVALSVFTPDNASEPYDQQDTWELLNNRVEKDLYEHPRSKALTDEEVKAIRSFLKFLPKNQALPIIGPPEDPEFITGDALTLFQLLSKGTNKYTTGEYVLRYNVTVSSRSSVVASFTNVEKLFPFNLTGAGGVTPPAGIGFSIANIPDKTASAPSGYAWKWLKIGPTVRSAPGGKIQISQEFWLDFWSTFIYEAV